MKKCQTCKQLNVRERNGIAVSKWCPSCLTLKKQEKVVKHKLTKTYQKSRTKTLHKKAWTLFSEYIRRKNADEYDMVQCFTCTMIAPWPQMQAGHFLHGKLDFDDRNIRPQCPQCNLYKSGNLAYYGVKLAQIIGVDGMEQLVLDSNTITYSLYDLERIIEEYTAKLKEL